MNDLTPKGFSNGRYVDRFLLRDKLYEEDAITMDGMAILNNFPAADVVAVVHGRWINAYPDIEPNPMFMYGICSQCGFEQSISDKLNYCPNCGAVMDGGQGDV